MFFGKKKKEIKELTDQVHYLQKLSEGYMGDCRAAWKEVGLYKAMVKDLKDQSLKDNIKIRTLKAEVSRLASSKNRLIKDKEVCNKKIKNITKSKKYYNYRDSKGRFTKK